MLTLWTERIFVFIVAPGFALFMTWKQMGWATIPWVLIVVLTLGLSWFAVERWRH